MKCVQWTVQPSNYFSINMHIKMCFYAYKMYIKVYMLSYRFCLSLLTWLRLNPEYFLPHLHSIVIMASIATIARFSAKSFMARAPSSVRFLSTIKYTPSHEYIQVTKLYIGTATTKLD